MSFHKFYEYGYRFNNRHIFADENGGGSFQGIFAVREETDSIGKNSDSSVINTAIGKNKNNDVYPLTISEFRVQDKIIQGVSYLDAKKTDKQKFNLSNKPNKYYNQIGWGLTRHSPVVLEENFTNNNSFKYRYYKIEDDCLYRKSNNYTD